MIYEDLQDILELKKKKKKKKALFIKRDQNAKFPDPGFEPMSLASSSLTGRFFTNGTTREAPENSRDTWNNRQVWHWSTEQGKG